MRKVVIETLMSLDGHYTDTKNQIDWFQFEDEDAAWSHNVLSRAGLLVFGRTTYEEFSKFFPTLDATAAGWDPYIPQQLNGLPKLVFSSSLKDAAWKPVTISSKDPAEEIKQLKRGDGKDILIVGSGSIVTAVARAGLVDEYWLRVVPIILGSGKPLFRNPERRSRLELVEARSFKHGTLGLHYVPRAEPESAPSG
jgi:dihydrofolate reductase